MTIARITELFNTIEKSIFTINPTLDYSELDLKFVELCQAIDTLDQDKSSDAPDSWIWIGQDNECQLTDLLVGAYWHYTNWHAGQSSDGYLALSAIGSIYSPGMECPPSDEEDEDEDYKASTSCYRLMNAMATKSQEKSQ